MTKSKIENLKSHINKDTRHCIIEYSVFIEECISETLGVMLEIDWKKSSSLGYKSGSLGFDQKVKLITDLKGISSNNIVKFKTFMKVRNKFAHIADIISFSSYSDILNSSFKEFDREIKKWYPDLKWDKSNIEEIYKYSYFLLTIDLFEILNNIKMQLIYHKGLDLGKREAMMKLITYLKEHMSHSEEGRKLFTSALNTMSNNT